MNPYDDPQIQCGGQYSVAVLRSMSRQLESYYLHTRLSDEQSKKMRRAARLTNEARRLLEQVERENTNWVDA